MLIICCGISLIAAPDSQPTMAVLPFQISKVVESVQVGGVSMSRELVENEFTHELLNFLTSSRKFNMLSRTKIKQVMDENMLTESDWSNPEQYKKVGNLLVADYLVTGVINRVDFQVIRQNIKITGETAPRIVATFKAQYEVVETNTGKIVSSGQVIEKLKSVDVRREIPASERKDWTFADYTDLLFARAAKVMGNKILQAVYPVKVTAIQNDGKTIILNRGQSAGIEPGEIYEVLNSGSPVIDVDTGENLGSSELKIAEIKIINVDVKFSQASIINESAPIKVGDICRPVGKKHKSAEPDYPAKDMSW
jgi:hypothetical protein